MLEKIPLFTWHSACFFFFRLAYTMKSCAQTWQGQRWEFGFGRESAHGECVGARICFLILIHAFCLMCQTHTHVSSDFARSPLSGIKRWVWQRGWTLFSRSTWQPGQLPPVCLGWGIVLLLISISAVSLWIARNCWYSTVLGQREYCVPWMIPSRSN